MIFASVSYAQFRTSHSLCISLLSATANPVPAARRQQQINPATFPLIKQSNTTRAGYRPNLLTHDMRSHAPAARRSSCYLQEQRRAVAPVGERARSALLLLLTPGVPSAVQSAVRCCGRQDDDGRRACDSLASLVTRVKKFLGARPLGPQVIATR